MKIFTTKTNYIKTAVVFLAVLFCLISGIKSWGQTTQTFTTSGNFTVPVGTYAIYVECYGAGGGGSTITSIGRQGGGGGGGAYAASIIYVTPGNVFPIVVGTGGAANTTGGASTFNGGTVKAIGGDGAASNSTVGANGGLASNSTGTIVYNGGDAGDGNVTVGYSGGGGGGAGSTGAGGSTTNRTAGVGTAVGGGNGGLGVTSGTNGTAGSNYGGGGSGASTNGGTDHIGGSGANGLVKVTYAIPYLVQFSALNTGAAAWCAGETRNITITVKNVGTATWTSGGAGVNFSYWWSNQGQDVNPRILPFAGLAPNQTQVITVPVVATTAGTYTLNFDLVREGSCWFRNNTSGCSGPGNALYTSPSITINALPSAPIGTTPQVFCASANPTLANLTATGTNIKWYAASSGGSALSSATPLVDGTHYYASQTNGSGCESSSRLDVLVTLNASPSITSQPSLATQSACIGSSGSLTALSVNATGAGLTYQWYSNTTQTNSGGSLIAGATGSSYTPSTAVAGTLYYYCIVSGTCSPTATSNASGGITINGNGAIALTSANNNQTFCLSNQSGFTPITYSIGGNATGANVSGLPPGMSGSYSAGVFTISGTATGSGTYNYIVTTTGSPCVNPSLTGTITVNDDGAIALSSASGTDNQSVCAGNAITNITYSIGGFGTTGATINWPSGVPSGISGNYSAGVFTISGTCSTPGTYNYTVTTTGPCTNHFATGSLTVNVSGTVTRTSAAGTDNQTVCYNSTITDITYLIGGDGSGATVTGLPAGVTGNYDGGTGIFTITGTPNNVSGTFNYTVTATGSSCTNFSANGAIIVNPILASGTVGSNQTICYNTAPTAFTSTSLPTGGTGTYTYQWQSSTDNIIFNNIAGATATTYTSGALTITTYFRRNATSGTCGTVSSNVITVTVNPNLVAGTVGSNQTICYNTAPAAFTSTSLPTGGTGSYTYQWQSAAAAGGPWNNIGGATSTAYAPGALTATTYYRRNETSGTCGTVSSNVITITVYAVLTGGTIGVNQTICYNTAPAAFTSSALSTGADGSYTYQWQSSPDNITFTNIGGATATTYTSGALTATTYFRRVASSATCGTSANSNVITIAVNPILTAGTVGSDQTICYNTAPAAFTSTSLPTGGTGSYTYQWQSSTDNITFNNIAGATGTAYTSGALTVTTYFRRNATSGTCGTVSSNVITVTVRPNLVAGTVGSNQTICYNTAPAAFTSISLPTGGTGSYTYQWQSASSLAGPYTNIGGATSTTYAPGALTATTYYRRNETSGTCGTVSSNVITVTVYTNLTGGTVGSDQEICANTAPAAFTSISLPTGGTGSYTYQWQSSTDNITFNNVAGATGTTYISGALTVTTYFRRNATSGGCGTASSNVITIIVDALPTGSFTATEISGTTNNDNIICAGDAVTFTALAGYGAYTFYVNGTKVQGPNTSNTYSSTTLTNGASVTVDVANSSNCGATFGPIVITVNPLPTPTLNADKTSICTGDNVTFTAGGGTNYNFKINGSSVQSSASNTYSTTALANGDIVTVDVTNNNGCAATSASVAITVYPTPSGSLSAAENSGIANDNKICAGSNVTFTATSGFSNYNFKVNGSSVQSSSSNVFSTTTLTNGNVVSVDVTNGNGCTASFGPPQVITVLALPSGSLTANKTDICAGENVIFTATTGFTNYTFYLNGTGSPLYNGTSNIYSTSTLNNGDYLTVVVSNSNGCTNTFTSPTITVHALPTGSLTASANPVCADETVDFTATPGFSNYNFKLNGASFQNGASNTASYTGFINGDVVTVVATNSNGCKNTIGSVTMTVNALPTGTLVPVENSGLASNDGIICKNDNVVFTADAGFSNYNFKLNGTTVQYSAANTYSTSSLNDGDVVTVEVTNSTNCVATFNAVTITVHNKPAVQPITGTPEVCTGKTTTLADATSGGVWNSSDNSIATVDASGLVTGVAAGTVTISYTVTNANGCSRSATLDVSVYASPVVAAITGPSQVCVNSTITLADVTTGGTWSSSDNTVATVDASGNVTGIAAGTATISYSVINANNCITVVTKDITVNALPVVAAITGTTSVCAGSTTALSDATSSGVWSSSDNSIATVNASGVVTGVSAGNVTISYSVTDANGCSTTVTADVTVNALPMPTLSGNNPICPLTPSTYTTEQGQSNYTWSVTGGIVTNGGTPNDYYITILWNATGPYSVYVNYTDPVTGCSGATSVTVTGNTSITPIVAGPATVCLNSAGNVYSTQSGQMNYVWTITGGTITSGGTSSDNTATVTWTSSGVQSISVNFTDAGGCTSPAPTKYDVTVKPLSVGGTVSSDATVCSGSNSGTLTLSGNTGAVVKWQSSTDGGTTWTDIANTTSSQTYTNLTQTTMYKAVVQNNPCTSANSSAAMITVDPLSVGGNVASDATVCYGSNSGTLNLSGQTGNVIRWESSTNGGTTWVPIANTTTSLTYNNIMQTTMYRAVVQSGSCSSANSSAATITVSPVSVGGTVASDATVCYGTNSGTLSLSGQTGSVTGWEYSTDGGTTWTPIANTTTSQTYTNLTQTTMYRAIVQSSPCSTANSTEATITVNPLSVGGTVASDATVCSGSNSGTLNLSGQTGTVIRWESSTDGGATWTSIANTTSSLTYTNITQTTMYRAVVQSNPCTSANSSPATITVSPLSVGGTVASNQTICSGSTPADLTLSGNTGSVVKWQKASDAAFTTPTDIANTTTTLTGVAIGSLTVTTYFRAVVQSSPCSIVNSASVTITVNPLPTATISGPANVCQNATANITFTGANGTSPYTFTYTVTGTPGNQTVTSIGNTATVAILTGAVTSYTYTLVSVKDNSTTMCSQNIAGQSVIVVVNAPPPAFVLTPASATICQGTVQPLSASSTASTTTTVTFNSTNNNIAIPDQGSIGNTITVSGIPAGAVINSMSVTFNITHGYDDDLILNLMAPNGKAVNLVDQDGGSGDNFTNTTISSSSLTPINTGTAPFTGTYFPDAINNVGGPVPSNVTSIPTIYAVPNGTWTFEAADVTGCHGGVLACLFGVGTYYTGTLNNWSITITYTVAATPLNVTWSPTTDLYTDPGATTAYTGTSVSTVYAKPSTSGTKTYAATASNAVGCTTSQNVVLTVNPTPTVTITADYCAVAGKVQLTASASPSVSSYLWSTGETTQTILVDEAGNYTVTAYSASGGCPGSANIDVANELVTNGDFEAGNAGFTSDYVYKADQPGLVPAGQGELYDDSGNNAYSITTSGQNVHINFWGHDHTTGSGNFMAVNGHGNSLVVWKQTVNVLPNTTYYFSAWAMSLNSAGNYAKLQFSVNGTLVGTTATLTAHGESSGSADNWTRFYGTWTSGPTTTSAVIYINDLQAALTGNDFGLDDVSFSTLSTFINLESGPGTDAQTPCVNTAITDIVYSVGSSATAPTVTGLPPGVTASFNGILLTISGTPTTAGNYSYTVTTSGSCQPATATGTINVQGQKITLTSGNASQTICINTAISNIVYTVSGTGTGATAKGLPAGVTGVYNSGSKTFTISGTPAVAGVFKDTVITTGTCKADTAYGTITVQNQAITLSSANNNQEVCVNTGIDPIIYTLGGTATNASASNLPPGVTGFLSGSSYIISGTPTVAGTYNYTVTTNGTCNPGATATGTIIVDPAAVITLSSSPGTDAQTVCISSPLTDITYTVSGTATGASITSGSLPAGVTGTLSSGVFTISGTPTVAGVYNFTITATGTCASTTISGSITVQSQTIALTSGSTSPTLCLGSTLTDIVFTIGGSATGISLSGSLPPGVSGNLVGNTYTISGTPTALGIYTYTVTTTGTCPPGASLGGTITVNNGTVGGNLPAITSICSGGGGTLNLTGNTGNVQRWEKSTDGGTTWTNIANTTTTLVYSGIVIPTEYRALVKSGSCLAEYSTVALIGIHNYWAGTTSTDWNVASNWSDGQAASSSCSMYIIPAGTPYSPQLTSATAVQNIIIAAGARLDLNGNTLTIDGAYSGMGTLTGSTTSGLVINGTAGTVYFTPNPGNTGNNYLQTFTVNSSASVTLGDSLNIAAGSSFGTVLTDGTINSNGMLTLKSDLAGTAMVGASAGKIAGDVTVERFIPARRAWRFLAVPLNSTTQTIQDAWQEGSTPNADIFTHNDPHPGYGTEITYDNNTAHGFDVNTTLNPSLKIWLQNSNSFSTYAPFTNTTPLLNYQAYCLFVRGSRAVDLSLATGAPADNTVLRIKGSLNETGLSSNNITKNLAGNPGEYLFIGNPFASSIDLDPMFARSSGLVDQQFWVWDPKLEGTAGVGGYVAYNQGIWAPTDGETGGTYGTISPRYIQSGQAFMVRLAAGSFAASLQIHQSDKTATQTNVFGFGKTQQKQTHPAIYSNIMQPVGDKLLLLDGVAAGFGNYSAAVDDNDAQKQWNIDENMALIRNEARLAIELRPMPVLSDTLFYKLFLAKKPYVLQIFSRDLPPNTLQGWLIDKYLNTKTAVNLYDTTLYNFTPNSDTNSYRNRFMLIFTRKFVANPVPVSRGANQNNPGTTGSANSMATQGAGITVQPNPVLTGEKVTLKLSSMDKGQYEVTISNAAGKALATRTILHDGGSNNYILQTDARWAAGIYIVKITNQSGHSFVTKLVISK